MTDPSATAPARIFTSWGTVLYVDGATGQLRHGAIETSPKNALIVADPTSTEFHRQGWITHASGETIDPIICGGLSCRSVSGASGGDPPGVPTLLELIPLERGLIAFRAGGLFLNAEPDGRVKLSNPVCSTWECFLASEDWCSVAPVIDDGPPREFGGPAFDKRRIAGFIVDARLRAKANATSKATKILIYGYPAWSHGRLFYDICKNLQRKGYIVDILNWQVNHGAYMGELIAYYDLLISPLDGLRTLLDVYSVPAEKVIGLSQHEMDIRILIGQMGVEVFNRLAGYGVTSYQLFDASVIFGVPRHPLVVQHGVAFDEFYAEPPERLTIVGYAGSFSHTTPDGLEIKRGEIAEAAAREAGLAFRVAGSTANQISFHDMPEFYKSVDAILISSVTEGAQLPVKEGAAAGRLVISTPVGDFPLRASQGVGIVAPIESHKYKKFVARTLEYYKENPKDYIETCRKTQAAARQLDWSNMIGDWVELIDSACVRSGQNPTAAGVRMSDVATEVSGRKTSDLPSTIVDAQDEAAWFDLLQRARRLRESGDETGFVKTALEAFRGRPYRGEPLHDLAHYYFGKSRGDIAVVYAAAGLCLPLPEADQLGVDPSVYHTGLKEVFTWAASYSKEPEEKERGRVICNWLSLSRDLPDHVRGLARLNYHWYAEPACSIMPSIQFYPVAVDAPDGFKPGNISIARDGDGFVALVRAVNYDLLDSGYFDRHGDTSYRQRTLLAHLDEHLQVRSSVEVLSPEDLPPPRHLDSLGFEDPRPIFWRGGLWCISSVRQLNPDGRAEMVLARIAKDSQGNSILVDWRVLASAMPVQWEKNWMPQVIGDELRFIYSLDPTRILSDSGTVLLLDTPTVAAENFRGGSQAIPFDGGWLMVIHEWQIQRMRRYYFHRFVWLDKNSRLSRVSRRFFFQKIASEFAAGLAWHVSGERLVVSFGIGDHEPTLAVVDAGDVRAVLFDINEHRRASEEVCRAGRIAWGTLILPEPLMKAADRKLEASDSVARTGKVSADVIGDIHLINLDVNVDRLRLFHTRNFHLDGVLRVSGIDGMGVDQRKLVADGIIKDDLPYLPGSLGCSLSHINLWKKAILLNQIITVFEDDVVCVYGFREKANALFRQLPCNWDIVHWGFDHSPKFLWLDLGFANAKLEFYADKWLEDSENFQTNKFLSTPVKIAHSFGLYGYSLSPAGARRLLEFCLPLRKRFVPFPGTGVVIEDICIDCAMCGVYPSMQAFACIPPLVLHDVKLKSDRIVRDERAGSSLGLPSVSEQGSVLEQLNLGQEFDHLRRKGFRHSADLCQLMTSFGSDKGHPFHNYTAVYDWLFSRFRNEELAVFELGVGTDKVGAPSSMGPDGKPGASLRAWRAYFPNAQVFGADIDAGILFQEERIRTFWVDQREPEAIRALWDRVGDVAFDIMVDDGLHEAPANICFFMESLWKLKPGGLYIIEDIGTGNVGEMSIFMRGIADLAKEIVLEALEHPLNDVDNRLFIFHKM